MSEGQVTDWPGMEGFVRRDLDIPPQPRRISTTNAGYKPKAYQVPKPILRPNFRVS